jgi:hypothetical protein
VQHEPVRFDFRAQGTIGQCDQLDAMPLALQFGRQRDGLRFGAADPQSTQQDHYAQRGRRSRRTLLDEVAAHASSTNAEPGVATQSGQRPTTTSWSGATA